MNEIGKALPYLAFWAVVALYIWLQHTQYMAGHETGFFGHKTPAEIQLRDAAVRKALAEADKAEAEAFAVRREQGR